MLRVTYWDTVVDPGFRGVDVDNISKEFIFQGKFKRMSKQQKSLLTRLNAVVPAVGRLKSDCHRDRCWLQQALGDAMHSSSCSAGYNQCWLTRAIIRLRISCTFLRLLEGALPELSRSHTRYVPAAVVSAIQTWRLVHLNKEQNQLRNLLSVYYFGLRVFGFRGDDHSFKFKLQ